MGRIKLNGVGLNFESIRVDQPVSETVLLFLHEALGSIPQWRNFPSALCKQLQINGIVYERQGHGHSDPLINERNKNYLHEYALQELLQFIEALFSYDQKIILVGHSDGGSIALLYAAAFPRRIQGVITMAAHVINEPETIAGILPAVHAYQAGKLSKLQDFHGEKTEFLFYAWANMWSSDEFKDWDIKKEISNSVVPILALQGSKDQYGTLQQLNLIHENVCGDCEIKLIPDCGHHPHLEKMNETIELIHNWVNRKMILKY
jgi:pimeloyl-ACP methyl ester carboxylesterase